MRNLLILIFASLVLFSCGKKNQSKTIYIVRHAEKQLEGSDPDLLQVGKIRAKKLAQILEGEEIKHIYSTDYLRTKNTALPTAEAAGLEIELYDPRNHDSLVQKLRTLEGNALVVGHSNTVNKLANYFVGQGEEYPDLTDIEYDYIFVVTLDANGEKVERKLYKDF
ncbi:SixA phosphatase family protein [Algoriphagus mannitolivorans]|uniref:SixA phosphatase family protein n=1 Tax=Algoriphagus mannitolivorans TaxID=226504 RepID=UPI00040E26E1|nr:phosphoglycerate mutase family protein [Algoriphagus mannitolivorans]